jgi:hypothetical protein
MPLLRVPTVTAGSNGIGADAVFCADAADAKANGRATRIPERAILRVASLQDTVFIMKGKSVDG